MRRFLLMVAMVIIMAPTAGAGVLRVQCNLQLRFGANMTYYANAYYDYDIFDYRTPNVSGYATLFNGAAVDQHSMYALPGHPDIVSGQWDYSGSYNSCYNVYAEAWEDVGGTSQGAGTGLSCTQGPPMWTLTLNSSVDGSLSLLREERYEDGTYVTVTPVTPSGYTFVGWSGDISSSDQSVTFQILRDMSVTANFTQNQQNNCTSCACDGTFCENSPTCPVILDLNGDGIHTTGLADPVRFWTDYDGEIEPTAWTDPMTEDAFLWMDLNADHQAQVNELFGSRMIAPGGSTYPNGYEALSKCDLPENGGDRDGQITQRDKVWAHLKLWVDRNHDGVSQPTEISVLSAHNIVALGLNRMRGHTFDENGNELYLVGTYFVRTHGNETESRLMADIEFKFVPYD